MSTSRLDMSSRSTMEKGFTLVELLVVVALLGILSALALGHLIRAKAAANEASAIGSLRAVVSGQSTFSSTCGQGYYAMSIPVLVAEDYLSPDLGLTTKSGYLFQLAPGEGANGPADCNTNPTRTNYYFTGTPTNDVGGRRAFATNSHGTIWEDVSGTPPPEPFEAIGTARPIDGQ